MSPSISVVRRIWNWLHGCYDRKNSGCHTFNLPVSVGDHCFCGREIADSSNVQADAIGRARGFWK